MLDLVSLLASSTRGPCILQDLPQSSLLIKTERKCTVLQSCIVCTAQSGGEEPNQASTEENMASLFLRFY